MCSFFPNEDDALIAVLQFQPFDSILLFYDMLQFIDIKEKSRVPKYKQIVDSILSAIERGDIKLNDKLPSINELFIEFDVSRDIAIKAYDSLKKSEVIDSIPSKGHIVRAIL